MKIFVFKQFFKYIYHLPMVNISYRTIPYDHLPPNENIIRKNACCLIFCVPYLLLLSKLFSYETLITFYALLMLERNPFWWKNPIDVRCYQFQGKIHIRFLAAVMDIENDHINWKVAVWTRRRFAQRSKRPSLSNHPNRKDLAEKTNFVTWISGREGNFDCKL